MSGDAGVPVLALQLSIQIVLRQVGLNRATTEDRPSALVTLPVLRARDAHSGLQSVVAVLPQSDARLHGLLVRRDHQVHRSGTVEIHSGRPTAL